MSVAGTRRPQTFPLATQAVAIQAEATEGMAAVGAVISNRPGFNFTKRRFYMRFVFSLALVLAIASQSWAIGPFCGGGRSSGGCGLFSGGPIRSLLGCLFGGGCFQGQNMPQPVQYAPAPQYAQPAAYTVAPSCPGGQCDWGAVLPSKVAPVRFMAPGNCPGGVCPVPGRVSMIDWSGLSGDEPKKIDWLAMGK